MANNKNNKVKEEGGQTFWLPSYVLPLRLSRLELVETGVFYSIDIRKMLEDVKKGKRKKVVERYK